HLETSMSSTEIQRRPPPPPPPQKRPAVEANAFLVPDRRPLGQILIERGVVGPDQLAEALVAQKIEDERVGLTLVRLGYCSAWDVCQGLAQQFGLTARESIKPAEVQDALVEQLPITYAKA